MVWKGQRWQSHACLLLSAMSWRMVALPRGSREGYMEAAIAPVAVVGQAILAAPSISVSLHRY